MCQLTVSFQAVEWVEEYGGSGGDDDNDDGNDDHGGGLGDGEVLCNNWQGK